VEVTRAGGADSPTAALAADYLSKRELLGAKTRVRGIDLSCTEEVWGSTLSSSGTHLGKGCGCDEMASDVLDAWLDGTGAVKATFVYGLHVNVPEYMTMGGSTYRFIHDHLGSPRLLVDSSSGAVVQRMDYDSFGRVLSDTSPGFQPFGFAGGLWDRDTGLVRFGARDYDPSVGRWTNKDPMRFAGGTTNLYEYATNDPVNRMDATGLFAPTIIIPVWAGAAAVAAYVYGLYDAWHNSANTPPTGGNTPSPLPYDPADPQPFNTGLDPATGGCLPCPPSGAPWEEPGNQHGSTCGSHWHWFQWDQAPDCTCYPKRMSGPSRPF